MDPAFLAFPSRSGAETLSSLTRRSQSIPPLSETLPQES